MAKKRDSNGGKSVKKKNGVKNAAAKSAKPAAKPTKAAKTAAKPAASKPGVRGYYVGLTPLSISLERELPNGSQEVCQCDTFDDARAAAIDALVDAIEQAEDRLACLK